MKKNIHPAYNITQVSCMCGNKFQIGSTVDHIEVEICSKCHPFYTGEQKIIDTANRVKSFTEKQKKSEIIKKETFKKESIQKNKVESTQNRPMTLRDMMQSLSK